jgi:imidazolonepropionase-like amidohydrolase
MGRLKLLVACIAMGSMASIAVSTQSRGSSSAVLYEGARLLIGDASAPIEVGAFVVQNGRITAVGRRGAVTAPAGTTRVDLTGKTVMPAMNNVHIHIGYEGYTKARSRGPARHVEQKSDHITTGHRGPQLLS